MDPVQELELLIRSRYPIIYLESWEEERVEHLLNLIAKNLKKPLFIWTSTKGVYRSDMQNPIYNTSNPLQALSHIQSSNLVAFYLLKDFHQHLEDPIIIRKLKDLSSMFEKNEGCLIISSPVVNIPPELKRIVVHFRLALPAREDLRKVVIHTLEELRSSARLPLKIDPEEINHISERLRGLTLSEAKRTLYQILLHDNRFTPEDFRRILETKKEIIEKSSILEFCYNEDSLSSLGGMKHLKAWLAKRKKAFGEKAEKFGLAPPKGILLLGVQGCGKSYAAKTIAREWNLPLVKLDPGKIYDKYIGESEKNLRQALTIAESMAPVVLWIDEIEKGFSYSQFSDADSGVSKRIFSAFLTWLQEKEKMVFVVATSNDIFALPPELLRKGRFDEIFFIDLPDDRERREIFLIHLIKREKKPEGFDIDLLVEKTLGFSGAEIEQLIISALYSAFSGTGNLTTELILEEIQNTKPLSITMSEKVEALREWAKERTIPAA